MAIVWTALKGKPQTLWLWKPATDLLWVAGGASLLYGAIAVPTFIAWPAAGVRAIVLFTQLGMLVNFPHYAATYETIYRERTKNPQAWTTLLASILPALAFLLVGGRYVEAVLPVVFRVYLAWSAYHYAAQHFGIASMYSARASAPLKPNEKSALKFAFVALAIPRTVRGGTKDLAYGPSELARYSLGVAVLALAVTAFLLLVRHRARDGRPFPVPVILLFVSQVIWELLPSLSLVSHAAWIEAVGALWLYSVPFFHCAQYLSVVGWRARTVGPVRPLFLYAGLVVGGFLLFRGLGFAWGALFSRPAQQLSLVVSVVNIHHFAVDGLIWRRRRMPATEGRTAASAPEARIAPAHAGQPFPETA